MQLIKCCRMSCMIQSCEVQLIKYPETCILKQRIDQMLQQMNLYDTWLSQ